VPCLKGHTKIVRQTAVSGMVLRRRRLTVGRDPSTSRSEILPSCGDSSSCWRSIRGFRPCRLASWSSSLAWSRGWDWCSHCSPPGPTAAET